MQYNDLIKPVEITVALPANAVAYIEHEAKKHNTTVHEAIGWLMPIGFWQCTTGKPVPAISGEADKYEVGCGPAPLRNYLDGSCDIIDHEELS